MSYAGRVIGGPMDGKQYAGLEMSFSVVTASDLPPISDRPSGDTIEIQVSYFYYVWDGGVWKPK